MHHESDLQLLRILHLADSALPIGTLSHSWGLETLADDGAFAPDAAQDLLYGFLEEPFLLEAVFCRAGYRAQGAIDLQQLNIFLSARKSARETREASLTLGRRFCRLLEACLEVSFSAGEREEHYAIAFGAACRLLNIPEDTCVLAFLEQSCAAVLSCALRLLPIGHVFASSVLWHSKPKIAETARRSANLSPQDTPCFSQALEIGSMRHPFLATRLFVS